MKNMLKISGFLSFLLLFFASCEKDNITTTVEELVGTEKQMETDLKLALGKSPNGWVMMVKSTLADTAYIPVVMQFDTTKNMVKMKSIYGTTANNKSTYLINKGVSGILLNFSGGSVISSLMRMDRSYGDVTDYVFKVLAVSPELIKIQCLKSGEAYKQEGGQVYTLFKRPDSWKWADDVVLLDMKTAEAKVDVNNINGILNLNYIPTSKKVSLGFSFRNGFDSNIAAWQGVDPFFTNASANVFDKFYIFFNPVNYSNTGTIQTIYDDTPVARQGYNALCYLPFSGNSSSSTSNAKFVKSIKTPYLVINEVIRNGANVTMKLASYDQFGAVYISAEYKNFN